MSEEKYDGQRPILVRALLDCDCGTHELKKGQQAEIKADLVQVLVKENKVEVVKEKAVRGEVEGKEKR